MVNSLAVRNKIIRYTHSLCQTRICTADHALTPLACNITVVLLRCFVYYEMQLLQRASRNPHGSLYINIYRMAQKERIFLNLPAISFFGVTSNQMSTFENLVQSTI